MVAPSASRVTSVRSTSLLRQPDGHCAPRPPVAPTLLAVSNHAPPHSAFRPAKTGVGRPCQTGHVSPYAAPAEPHVRSLIDALASPGRADRLRHVEVLPPRAPTYAD